MAQNGYNIFMSITSSMREYLATIYHLQQYEYQLHVDAVHVAEYLEVSSPAVTRMFNRLEKKELIMRGEYGTELTIEGTAEASKGLRWQRILECFLFENLGFEWHELHDRARKMLGGADDELIERMSISLGDPKLSPYGEYIPSIDSLMPRCDDETLDQAMYRVKRGVISRIRTHDIEIKNQLDELGIVKGLDIAIMQRGSLFSFDREMYFSTEEQDYFLPEILLNAIWIKEADHSAMPIDGLGMHLWSMMYLHNRVHGETAQIRKSREYAVSHHFKEPLDQGVAQHD